MPPPRHHPDPSRGVFETLLVSAGEPVALPAHLRRLEASVQQLYGAELPGNVAEQARAATAATALGRVRLTATPGTLQIALTVKVSRVDPAIVFPAAIGAQLRSVRQPGGLGAHKWVDRDGLDRPRRGRGTLVCDGEEALEAGWANVFVATGETLRTPPTDGRILAGTTRATVLALAAALELETREEPLYRDDLVAAEEVFLTNSIRGIEPIQSLDGTRLGGSGPLSRRLAGALARSWRLPAPRSTPATPAAAPQPGPPAR